MVRGPRKGEPLNASELRGDAREGFGYRELGKRLGRYGSARALTVQFRDFLSRFPGDRVARKLVPALSSCGSYLLFRHWVLADVVKLAAMRRCDKHLACSLCAIFRASRAMARYIGRFEALMREDVSLSAWFVTLTVKDGPDLWERFSHLSGCLRRYHARRTRERQHGEVRKAVAGVWSFEVKRGAGSGLWHPHVHAIWLCRGRPDPVQLGREWHALTGDSFVVDVRPVDAAHPAEGFAEVFKYALKFGELDHADRLHAFKELSGARLRDSFGAFRGLDVEDAAGAEVPPDEAYVELLFRFVNGVGYRPASD